MKPYLYGRRNSIHIIDIKETLKGLLRAKKFLVQSVARGEEILFVGTKRQAREAIQHYSKRCGMHFVTERWLGGTLTNARTIRSRLDRLRELEELRDSPAWETRYSKKMKSMLSRELRKIDRNLGGIRDLNRLPGALIVVDVRKEQNALREAQSLQIPTICLIDSDSDPDWASIPVPGNDDAMRSIDVVLNFFAEAIEEGKKGRPEPMENAGRNAAGRDGGRRRHEADRAKVEAQGAVAVAPAPAAAAPTPAAPVEAPTADASAEAPAKPE